MQWWYVMIGSEGFWYNVLLNRAGYHPALYATISSRLEWLSNRWLLWILERFVFRHPMLSQLIYLTDVLTFAAVFSRCPWKFKVWSWATPRWSWYELYFRLLSQSGKPSVQYKHSEDVVWWLYLSTTCHWSLHETILFISATRVLPKMLRQSTCITKWIFFYINLKKVIYLIRHCETSRFVV